VGGWGIILLGGCITYSIWILRIHRETCIQISHCDKCGLECILLLDLVGVSKEALTCIPTLDVAGVNKETLIWLVPTRQYSIVVEVPSL
jgi:hypothetical protein